MSSRLAAGMSPIEVERRLLDAVGWILGRCPRCRGCGVEAFMTSSWANSDQLAGILPKPGERERVTQAVGGDRGAGQNQPADRAAMTF
jgi:hypothetical protein